MFNKIQYRILGLFAGGTVLLSGLASSISVTNNQGQVGSTGPTGPTGQTGATGPTGASGATGATGATGTTGASGTTGAQGPAGETGANGETPYIGENGNWWIGLLDTGISASGTPQETPSDYYREAYDLLPDSITIGNSESFEMDDPIDGLAAVKALTFTNVGTEAEFLSMTSGNNYRLTSHITFTSPVTPFADLTDSNRFEINLDGNGFELRNLVMTEDASSYFGLFRHLINSTIFDLTIVDATITNTNNNNDSYLSRTGILAGFVENSWFNNIVLTTTNGVRNTVTGPIYVGGLFGALENSELVNVTLENLDVSAFAELGGLMYSTVGSKIKNLIVRDIELHIIYTLPNVEIFYWNSTRANAGGVAGYGGDDLQFENILIDDVKIDTITGSVSSEPGNVNNQQVTATYSVGGFFGRISGNSHDTISRFEDIVLTNSLISGGGQVSGLVGNLEDDSFMFTDVLVNNTMIYAGELSSTTDTIDYENLSILNLNNLNNGVGSVIGQSYSTGLLLNNIFTNATIYGSNDVGGIIGASGGNENEYEFFYAKNITSNATIKAESYKGGIAGNIDEVWFVVLENVANHSDLLNVLPDNSNYSVGGLVGEIYEIEAFVLISNSYNTGDIQGDDNLGGFIGYNEIEGLDDNNIPNGGLIIYNSYNIGDIYGNSEVGGFVGQQYDQTNIMEIYNSFQFGRIYLEDGDTPSYENDNHGGFVGENENSNSTINIFNSYFLNAIDDNGDYLPEFGYSGTNTSSGGNTLSYTGFITTLINGGGNATGQSQFAITDVSAFKNPNNFMYKDVWNFELVWTFEVTNNGYPTLIHAPVLAN